MTAFGASLGNKKMAPIKGPFWYYIFLSIFSIFFIPW